MKCCCFLLFYNALDLNNQKILCLPSIYEFERKLGFWTTLKCIFVNQVACCFILSEWIGQFYFQTSSKVHNRERLWKYKLKSLPYRTKKKDLHSKWFYRSRAERHFYEYKIWAGFGLVLGRLAVLKINWVVKYATFEGSFLCFHGQKKKYIYIL